MSWSDIGLFSIHVNSEVGISNPTDCTLHKSYFVTYKDKTKVQHTHRAQRMDFPLMEP